MYLLYLLLENPSQFIFDAGGNTQSVNGSCATGHCSSVTGNTCLDPTSSVLFDGIIPTLTGLNGNTWACQLLTMRTCTSFAVLSFDFTGTPNFVGLRRVEMVLFNCPQWDITFSSIQVVAGGSFIGAINPTVTSCDSLVRVCMPLNTNSVQTELTLNFITVDSSHWVHTAEVTFYGAGTCEPDTIITTPTAASTTQEMTTTGKLLQFTASLLLEYQIMNPTSKMPQH